MRPQTPAAAAQLLREAAAAGRRVLVRGGATKLGWADPGAAADVELDTRGLGRLVAHNAGDFTAVVEAGATLAGVQAALAEADQMLALDPPDGGGAATLGGVLATSDSGPLRHRYGAARDLVVGMTVALSDGALAKSGGLVIKNVAGYDLAKLFCGSFGTLGLIAQVALRLHPRPPASATALGEAGEPERLAAVAQALAGLPLEADCLDVAWHGDKGRVLVRFGGAAAGRQARAVAERMELDARVAQDEEDAALWDAQRAAQRSQAGAVLKVSARASDLPHVLRTARDHDGRATVRAALGLAWIAFEGADLAARVAAVRDALAPRACVLLDAPDDVRAQAGTWPAADPGSVALMRRVKARFDPPGIMRPGAFVGGI